VDCGDGELKIAGFIENKSKVRGNLAEGRLLSLVMSKNEGETEKKSAQEKKT
jgi:hypothetical protein